MKWGSELGDLGNPDVERGEDKGPAVGRWYVQDRMIEAKWVNRRWWEMRLENWIGQAIKGVVSPSEGFEFCSKDDEKQGGRS